MNSRKRICIGMVFCLVSLLCHSQKIKPLKVGDKCPDFAFKNLMFYSTPNAKLSDFKGKLVILDFGGPGCKPCLASLERMDSLKKTKFGNAIAPIFVTYANKKDALYFLNRAKLNLASPYIYDDTTLSKYFPHTYIPHLVWINKAGYIVAITGHEYVTRKNIEAALSGTAIDWPVKYDSFDPELPLVKLNETNFPFVKQIPSLGTYSAFTSHIDGVAPFENIKWSDRETNNDTIQGRVTMINMPVLKMYMLANDLTWTTFLPTHILFEVKDVSRYDYEQFDKGENALEWEKKNLFSYDAVFPSYLPKDEMKQQVTKQLDIALGLHGRLEKKRVNCWVLESSLKYTAQLRQIPPPEDSIWRGNKTRGYITIENLLWNLNWHKGNPPAVDETGITKDSQEKHYLWLSSPDFSNRELMNDQIQPYGLSIVSGKREVEMLVITENGYKENEK